MWVFLGFFGCVFLGGFFMPTLILYGSGSATLVKGGGVTPPAPSLSTAGLDRYLKSTLTTFPPFQISYFMVRSFSLFRTDGREFGECAGPPGGHQLSPDQGSQPEVFRLHGSQPGQLQLRGCAPAG
jgi:hypothetical protein